VRTEAALRALAEPNRLAILTLIRTKELLGGQITEDFKTQRSAVSQHLRVVNGRVHAIAPISSAFTAVWQESSWFV